METLFTWIHLSDLHVRAREDQEGKGLDDAMLAALRRDLESQGDVAFDALFVTGDIAWSGQREEYVAADAFLVAASRAIGLGPEKIYVVPGNHDVDRNADRGALTGKLVAELRGGRRRLDAALEHARAKEVLSARVYPFSVFATTFGPQPEEDDAVTDEHLFWSRRLEGRGGLKIRVVGISTGMLSDGDTDRGLLRIGELQLDRAGRSIRSGELVVVLGHHPVQGGWLADEHEADMWLREHAHVFLTGHAHDAIADEARAGAYGAYVWVTAGAAPAKRKVGFGSDRRLGYAISSIVRAGDGSLSLRVSPRRWSPEMRRFTLDDRWLPRGEVAALHPLGFTIPALVIPRPSAPPPPALARPSVLPAPFGASAGSYSFTPLTPVPPPVEDHERRVPSPTTPPPPATRPERWGLSSTPTPPPVARVDRWAASPEPPVATHPATPAPPLARAVSARKPNTPSPPRAAPNPPNKPAAAGPIIPPPFADDDDMPAERATGSRDRQGADREPPSERPAPKIARTEAITAPEPAVVRAPQAAALRAVPVPSPEPQPTPSPFRAPRGAPSPAAFRALRGGLFEGPGALPVTHPGLFTARDAELDAIEAAVDDPTITTIVLTGMGGAGKSALAQEFVASRAPEIFDEGVWMDARELPAEVGRVAKRWGWKSNDRLAGDARAYLKTMLEKRRVLVVVDNVSPGAADVRALPTPGGGSRMIVTTRIGTLHEDIGRGARPIRVGTWDGATSRAHLATLVPALADESEAVLDDLTSKVDGLPLAVRLIGRQLGRADVSPAGLATLLDRDLRNALDSGARAGEPTITSTFQPAFEALNEPLRRTLVALSACATHTRAGIVAELAASREDEVSLALEGLADQAFVLWDPDAERPFGLHPVVRAFLRSRPGAIEVEAAHEGLVLGRVMAHADPSTWNELEQDLPEVFAVIDRRVSRGEAGAAWEMLKAVLGLLERRDRYADFIVAARRILRAAPEGGPTAAAVLADLGVALASMGDIAEARTALMQSLALAEDGGYRDTEALALSGLGRVHAILGELAEATAHHRRAGALHELLGMRRLFAIDLANVGLLLRRSGNVGDAIDYLERALALHEELDEPEGRAESLGGLGLCFRDIGELDTAIDHFHRALSIHEDLGRRAGQATMLGNLGNTYRALGALPEAVAHLQSALSLYEELGMPEGQGAALGNLGACYRALGEPALAREHYERALAALRRIGLPDDHPHVRVILNALGEPPRRPRG